jgi:hypothetical protein
MHASLLVDLGTFITALILAGLLANVYDRKRAKKLITVKEDRRNR